MVAVALLVAVASGMSAAAATPLIAEPLKPQLAPDVDRAVTHSSLLPGEQLSTGRSLHSPSGRYRLTLQLNGNLVLYDTAGVAAQFMPAGWTVDVGIADGNVPFALWDARTDVPGSMLIMRPDGDLVMHSRGDPDEPVWHTRTADRPGAFLSVSDDGAVTVGYSDGRVLWSAGTSTPAVGLAGTKHVVYDRGGQRMWLIEADGTLFDTYPVSGRATSPAVGAYSVFSKSQYSSSPRTPVTMRHMVRFVKGITGLDIGFHSIPRTYAGLPIQTVADLGQPRSAGCVRQDDTKAQQLFDWAPIGTPVVVIA